MPQDEDFINDVLEHYGVRGMKWGRHKTATASTPKISRKQNRQMNREAAAKFDAEKATKLYKEAKKLGDKVMIQTRLPGDTYPTVVTGKEFARHLEAGGMMNVRATEVYARQQKGGQYELNSAPIGNYKKQNFRKPKP